MLYALTIFLSSLLLFLVQPLIGKAILPWFGGSSAVWSVSMLFFQLLLLAGYLYSHVLVKRLAHGAQMRLHLVLVTGALLWMGAHVLMWRSPILPADRLAANLTVAPWLRVLLTLAASVGVPTFVLSTTSPLIQAWYAAAQSRSALSGLPSPAGRDAVTDAGGDHAPGDHGASIRGGAEGKARIAATPARSPYPLYALSNIASMLALLGYPFGLEPLLPLRAQAWAWSAGYLAFALGLGALARTTFGVGRDTPRRTAGRDPQGLAPDQPATAATSHRRAPARAASGWHPVLWLALSATASVLLLATTNQITQFVAAVPLLWVGPLAIYLLTFVIAFGGDRLYSRWTLALLFVMTQLFGTLYLRHDVLFPVAISLTIYGLLLFSGCLVCHGELARLRPDARDLTRFYLVVAVGGALGGVLVNLVAPVVLADTREFPLAVMACWVFAGLSFAATAGAHRGGARLLDREWAQLIVVGVFVLSIFSTFYITLQSIRAFRYVTLAAERNFYGVLRIQEAALGEPPAPAYRMVHGTTIHGVQLADPAGRELALSYFGPTSGVGMALVQQAGSGADQNRSAAPAGRRIGVLGLGVGTLAAYGQEGDVVRFYEIDPAVIRYAEGEGGYFSYLADTPAAVEIIEGDARVALTEELARGAAQRYDFLAVDVFSGDAPPVHLLTREAMELYLAHLALEGVLAVNISATRMNLKPVLAALALDLDLHGVIVEDTGGVLHFPSRWVVLVRDPRFLNTSTWSGASDLQQFLDPRLRLWTDDYSNLVQVLR